MYSFSFFAIVQKDTSPAFRTTKSDMYESLRVRKEKADKQYNKKSKCPISAHEKKKDK
jgi:hypothetical protein